MSWLTYHQGGGRNHDGRPPIANEAGQYMDCGGKPDATPLSQSKISARGHTLTNV